MKTPSLLKGLLTLITLTAAALPNTLLGQIIPGPAVISIRSTVPETREPFCDPTICDAAPPPPGVFVLTRRGGDPTRDLGVMIGFGGSASNGVDYTTLPTWVMFRSGSLTTVLQVEANYDLRPEGDELVVAQVLPDPTMGPIARYTVDPVQSAARVVIHDNEPPQATVRIDATSRIAEETSAPLRRLALRGRFTISRTGPVENALPIFVHYSGSATSGVDYPMPPWFVEIPAGTNSVEIEIVPKQDDVAEPIEIIEATLSECPPLTDPPMGIPCYLSNIDPAHSSARVFIRDDGITTATVSLTAPLNGASFLSGQPIRIAAQAIDLDGAITHLDFLDGETKIGDSTILFIREPDPGTPIDHEFIWNTASSGMHELLAAGLNTAGETVRSPVSGITVAGGLPVVSIEATRAETSEPSPFIRIAPGLLTLRRTGDTARGLRVWMRYDGTAIRDVDYSALPFVVEFPAGSPTVELQVVALDDQIVEGDEMVIAQIVPSPLAIPPDHQIDPARNIARVVIHDSTIIPPVEPAVTIIATDAFAREGTNSAGQPDTATFVVRRTGPTNEALTVHLAVSGTASNGVDYWNIPGEVTIRAGQRRAEIRVVPVNDRLRENIETIVIGLVQIYSILPSYTVGIPARAAAIIVDNDRVRPPCLRLPDGLFNLCVPTPINPCFRVEVTRDFKDWTPLCTIPVNDGTVHYVDPDAPDRPRGFYRLVPVPCEEP